MNLKAPPYITEIAPYVPGKPIEELERQYGITGSVKLASNENPLGPSPMAVAAITAALAGLNRYPEGAGPALVAALAEHWQVDGAGIVLGNGSDEIIAMVARVLLAPGDEAVIPRPSFLIYDSAVRACGAKPVAVPLKDMAMDLDAMAKAVTPATRLVFVCNPNNPTGTIVRQKDFEAFLARLPDHVVTVVDEAYIEFARAPEVLQTMRLQGRDLPLVTLRTFSKAYGLAGLRIGYGVMPPALADLIHRVRLPFNAGSLAQAGALAALKDEAFLRRTIATVHEGLDALYRDLAGLPLRCLPTQANFFLIDLGCPADAVFEKMLHHGVIVRSMTSYGFCDFIRVNAGLPEENRRLVAALKDVLGEKI